MSPSKPKVLVAMSGGVDSSVAAAMLVRDGYEVIGCFMRLGSPGETLDELRPSDTGACRVPPASADVPLLQIRHRGCCSINDAADARAVASELGIPFYVCNFKKDFGRIIDYFVDEYAAGRTPNPCVRCNDWLKFGKLHEYARQVGAEFVASGHYARVAGDPARLLRAVDRSKDQSYVLFGMPREQLAGTMLPIGEFPKTEVREMARRFGLPVFDKPDSQEICFVPDDDYAGLVESRRPGVKVSGGAPEGRVVDENGRVLGTHAGQHRYTIGQRRGLGIATGDQVFVVDKDAASNTVTVAPRERLRAAGCTAREANWLLPERSLDALRDAEGWITCEAKVRYNSEPVAARVCVVEDAGVPGPSGRSGAFEVRFDAPLAGGVAPGQAVVLYHGEAVLGGGWIASAIRG